MKALKEHSLSAVMGIIVIALACSTAEMGTGSVTVEQLSAGHAHCPTGGVAITASGTTAYACNGAQGVQGLTGPTGGGLYTSRDDVYCTYSTEHTGMGGAVAVSCKKESDLPLSGGCEPYAAGTLIFRSQPVDWFTSPGYPASWECHFATSGGSVGEPGVARICCVNHP